MKNISSTKLRPNPLTPTLYKVDSSFERLVQSVSLFGVLEPLVVFPISNEPGHFQVVSGNRRLHAVKELGLTEVPCTFIEPVELTESRVSAHQEYPIKQPSDIIRELRILEDEFGLRQGVRSNNPRIKEARAYKNQLVKDHKKSTIHRLRQFDKKVRQLVQDDTDKYNRFMSDLDRPVHLKLNLHIVMAHISHNLSSDIRICELYSILRLDKISFAAHYFPNLSYILK